MIVAATRTTGRETCAVPVNFRDPKGLCWVSAQWGPDDGPNTGEEPCSSGDGNSGGMQIVNGGPASKSDGGGGGPLAAWVTNTSARMAAGFALALAALQNPLCAGLFNLDPNAPDPAALFRQAYNGQNSSVYFTTGFIASESANTMTNAVTRPTSFASQNGVITQTGVANKAVVVINYDPNAPFNKANTIDNAVTMLHELGHVYELLYGLGSTFLVNDSVDVQGSRQQAAAASAYNTKLVKTNCFPGAN